MEEKYYVITHYDTYDVDVYSFDTYEEALDYASDFLSSNPIITKLVAKACTTTQFIRPEGEDND